MDHLDPSALAQMLTTVPPAEALHDAVAIAHDIMCGENRAVGNLRHPARLSSPPVRAADARSALPQFFESRPAVGDG